MRYIYIDESGDIGKSRKYSEYFIMTSVEIYDEHTNILFNRIPKLVRKSGLKKKFKNMPELKFSNSSRDIRERFLNKVAKLHILIFALVIKKKPQTNLSYQDALRQLVKRVVHAPR